MVNGLVLAYGLVCVLITLATTSRNVHCPFNVAVDNQFTPIKDSLPASPQEAFLYQRVFGGRAEIRTRVLQRKLQLHTFITW